MTKRFENRDEMEKELESYNTQNDIRREQILKSSILIEEYELIVKKYFFFYQKTKTTVCIGIFPVSFRKYSWKK